MKRRYLLIYSIIVFLIIPAFYSCTSEAETGSFFTGKSFEGISGDDLYSRNYNVENLELEFPQNGLGVFRQHEYNYYDCTLQDGFYPELKPLLEEFIQAYAVSASESELEEYSIQFFDGLKTADMFVLSSKKLEKVDIDLENEKFNFKGYMGLGWQDNENYMIVITSTQNLKKRYFFGK